MIGLMSAAADADRREKRRRTSLALSRMTGARYLGVLFVTPVASQFAQHLLPATPIAGSQSLGVVLAFIGTSIAAVLWLLYVPKRSWPPLFELFLGGLLVAWMMAMWAAALHGDPFNPTAILVPVALVMIWLKRPRPRDVWLAGDAFAWSVIAVAVAAQALDWLGFRELRYDFWNRLPVITELIGPIGRWEGPFGNSNLAGPIGAFLLAYGLFRFGLQRWTFVTVGSLIVFLSDSRTAYFAVFVALLVAVLYRPRIGRLHITRRVRLFLLLGFIAAFVALIILLDPTLNNRTAVWSTFWTLWSSSPVIGVGGEGILEAIQGDALLGGWATHGHNILIDPLARVGLLGLAPLMVALIAAFLLTVREASHGKQAALVVLACFLASGVTEDLVDWRYLGYQAVPLLLASMLSVGTKYGREWLPR